MEVIRVGIRIADAAFADALAVGLSGACPPMLVEVLERGTDADGAGLADRGQDLILQDAPGVHRGEIQLVREPEAVSLCGEPFRVYRYRESQNLARDLLHIYFLLTGRQIAHRTETSCRLVVFAAGGGGWGTTRTALAVCRMLYRRYGSRCLYLNLCPVNDAGKYLDCRGDAQLVRFLFELDQARAAPLDGLIAEEEELDFVDLPLINRGFDAMTASLCERLLDRVAALGRYTFLVADVGNCLCRSNRALLRQADVTVAISKGREPTAAWYRQAMETELRQLTANGRYISVENFAADAWEPDDSDRLSIEIDRQSGADAAETDSAGDGPRGHVPARESTGAQRGKNGGSHGPRDSVGAPDSKNGRSHGTRERAEVPDSKAAGPHGTRERIAARLPGSAQADRPPWHAVGCLHRNYGTDIEALAAAIMEEQSYGTTHTGTFAAADRDSPDQAAG